MALNISAPKGLNTETGYLRRDSKTEALPVKLLSTELEPEQWAWEWLTRDPDVGPAMIGGLIRSRAGALELRKSADALERRSLSLYFMPNVAELRPYLIGSSDNTFETESNQKDSLDELLTPAPETRAPSTVVIAHVGQAALSAAGREGPSERSVWTWFKENDATGILCVQIDPVEALMATHWMNDLMSFSSWIFRLRKMTPRAAAATRPDTTLYEASVWTAPRYTPGPLYLWFDFARMGLSLVDREYPADFYV